MKKELKAHIAIWNVKEKRTEKFIWTLTEAEEKLPKKVFEKLISWGGIHTAKYNGYVA